MRRLTMILFLCVAFLVIGGCDTSRDTFDKVQLGCPIPSVGLPADGSQGTMGYYWSKLEIWPFPSAISYKQLMLVTPAGCTAKFYKQYDWVNLGLDSFEHKQIILEIEVPQSAFHEIAMGQETKKGLEELFLSMHEIISQFDSGLAPQKTGLVSDNKPTTIAELLRLERAEADKKAATQPEAGKNIPWEYICSTVPGYLACAATVTDARSSKPVSNRDDLGMAIMSAMIICLMDIGNNNEIVWLITETNAFDGITRSGYVWQNTDNNGSTFTVRNLGGRRIRIEIDTKFNTIGGKTKPFGGFYQQPEEPSSKDKTPETQPTTQSGQ